METYFEHTQEQTIRQAREKLRALAVRPHPVKKFVGVLFLILCLMVPLSLIESQIYARSHRQDQVTREIANASASSQTVIGPILAIRYQTKIPEKEIFDVDARRVVTKEASFIDHIEYLPAKKLSISGAASVERRYRGIYQARLFHFDAGVEGTFEVPENAVKIPNGSELVDAKLSILMEISDRRGLDFDPEVMIDGRPLHFKAVSRANSHKKIGGQELEIDLGEWKPGQARAIAFSFPLKLTGTESLSISPTAENNVIEITSDWPHPGFGGRFLPRKRTVDEKGFAAQWEISQLARNLENAIEGDSEILKVSFIDPVNVYLQAERAVKYGSLFIVLTFAAFFIGEFLRRRPMHILQYALVGLALAIFFLLLIALSEHLPFAAAYLASAVPCIGLIIIYLGGAFGSWRAASGFGTGLAVLYGMLFGILQMEDRALLMGSLLLFAALAAAMFSTRRLDWYQLKQSEAPTEILGE